MLKIREFSLKLPKYLGIERTGDKPKLWIEEIGERRIAGRIKLGVFWISFIILFLYFFLLDMLSLSLLLIIGRPIDLYLPIKEYMFFTLSWQVVVWFVLYLLFYFKTIYLKTVNSLFDENRIIKQDYDRLRLQLLSPKYRFFMLDINRSSIIKILSCFWFIIFIISLTSNLDKPNILWIFIPLENTGLKYSDSVLIFVGIYTILRWIGNLFQVIILADLFTILFSFLNLGNKIEKILKVDLLNADRRGGYGFIGILYFKIAVLYFIALLLFFGVTRDYPINHPNIIGSGSYWLIITTASFIALILFILPQISIHKNLEKKKGQCIKKIFNKLKESNVQDLDNDSTSVYPLRTMLFLNEIDKMKTYPFSDSQLIIISFFYILINLVNSLFKLKEIFPLLVYYRII